MPINKNLNVDPYFDDFDLTKQYHRILFKPSYAVQARELTQVQTILQNQIEQFGDNIFKEGTIVKGCNFTELSDLNYVKVTDKLNFDVTAYVGFTDTVTISSQDYERDNTYELRGSVSGVTAVVVAAARGFETRNPDLNTFFINYNSTSSGNKIFQAGELLRIFKISTVIVGTSINRTEEEVATINVTTFSGAVGNSFGLRSSPGIIFQKGHFLYAEEQLVIVSKYTNAPDNVSIGYITQESVVNAFQDSSLYDNANGSFNQNAPGADRLKLTPVLTALPTTTADLDNTFFTLTRYVNGNAIILRDVSQYNALGEEMARRTFEESGDYIVKDFKTKVIRKDGNLTASVGSGTAYVKGYRVENLSEQFLTIDSIANTSFDERTNQAISFNYGGYIDLENTSSSGVVTLGDFSVVTLKNAADSNIGTARVRNVTNDKIFLFDIRLTSTNKIGVDLAKIVGSSGAIRVANTALVKEAGKTSMVFDTGMISLKSIDNISIPVRAQKSLSGLSGNTVTISPSSGEDFNLENDDILFVNSSNIKIDVSSASLSGPDLILTLDTNTSANATAYLNTRILNATPFTKTNVELFVKSTFSSGDISSSSARYNLGFPDVYELISVTDSANTDVTSSFRLRTNQKDNYYDHSYIEYIPGRPVPANGLMIVNFNAFKLNDTTGDYFFTVDSYPIGIEKNKIQTFTSSSGKVYNLRDCLDFRPYVEPLSPATYSNALSIGSAPTVSDGTTGVDVSPTFSNSYTILTPALNQFGQLDYEFFFNRIDVVSIDSYGKISLTKGIEAERSSPPLMSSNDQLKIAEIFVPGNPALTPEESNTQDKPKYGVKISSKGTKAYRMKDIESLEKKVDNLKYYVLLSALEAETKNLNIVDENGLDRFKNGIIVDPFNDLSIANIKDTSFSAAIDFTEKSLMPSVKTYPLKLKYKSSTTSTLFPSTSNAKIGTIQRNTDIPIITQPYSTEFRNCVSNFYSYKGVGELSPEYDAMYDTTTNPVNIDIDFSAPLTQLVDAIQEFIPLTSTSSEVIDSVTTINRTEREIVTTTDETFRDTVRRVQLTGQQVNEQKVGDFVTNFTFNPFMRGRDVGVYMAGLRPNTRHYFFFDGVDVNSFVSPGSLVNNADEIRRSGSAGAAISSDSNGVLRAVFSLPAATFFVGDRKLEVVDVDQYSSISSASTSYGFLMYRAYNFSIEKAALTVSTRSPENFISRTSSDRNVSRRSVQVIPPPPQPERDNDRQDPIAQTFFIKSGMGLGSDTVFLSKIDLFFKRKSSVNGITVEIREVINGFPSYTLVPFSKTHLTSSEVLISDDSSIATTVTFKAPIRLDVEKEYAIVVIPDGADPDYLIFTSKVGGVNLTPGANKGLPIIQDWGDGVLFTSTNNRAWKSYQDEDIKFTLYRHNFNASSGTITLTNDDHEFITTTNNQGVFKVGEIIYTLETVGPSTSNTVSTVSGNNRITGTDLSATYSTGDHLIVDDGFSNKQIFKVLSANSTVIIADRPAAFTDSLNAHPITLGTLVHYDFRYPNFMILEGSTATSSRKFVTSDTIYGFDSDSEATVSSVDNAEFSYIQPMILRTNDTVTNTILSGSFVDPNNTSNTYQAPMPFNDKTTFGKNGMIVFSKSNDTARTKTLDLTVTMTNNSNVTSTPFVDIETASLLAYQWKITQNSLTTSKYISKTVELSDNIDAEDFQVFVTGYRPSGTDIKVFIKPQAANDQSVFEKNDWIELELFQGLNRFSSISNTNDFREYVYRVSESDKSSGVITYSNDLGVFSGYRRFAIKIELHSDTIFKAPRLLDYRGIALT